MAVYASTPSLTTSNRVYLYRLLRDALGAGKQTFLPRVEEALASDGLIATDLGFADTRALLEALDGVVQLTVFKGGRVYATVVAQEAWDAALEKAAADADDTKAKAKPAGGKSWKRKRADKTIKPVRPQPPKRAAKPKNHEAPTTDAKGVERTEEAPGDQPAAALAKTASAPDAAAGLDAATASPVGAPSAAGSSEHGGPNATQPANASDEDPQRNAASGLGTGADSAQAEDRTAAGDAPSEAAAATSLDDAAPDQALNDAGAPTPTAPQPAISLTIIYDPEHANTGVTTLESTPVVAGAAPAAPAADDDAPRAAADNRLRAESAQNVRADSVHGAAASAVTEASAVATRPANAASPATPATAAGQPSAPMQPDPVAAPPAHAAAHSEHPFDAHTATSPTAAALLPDAAPAAAPAAAPQTAVPTPDATPAAATVAAPSAPAAAPAPSTDALRAYPRDFAAEVYCPGPLLSELARLLPLGADVMGIAGEYFYLACERGTADLGRNRAAFPLRYLVDGERRSVIVHIRKRSRSTQGTGPSAIWAIDAVEPAQAPRRGTPTAS